ncbi:MAG: mannose-1-phosphate guanylyltransferase, partial [Acidobacteriota bacterium]
MTKTTGQADLSEGAGKEPVDPHAFAVIIAGGGGTRFWPLSRRRCPKQFLAITNQTSLLQSTWERALALVAAPERVLVVTAAEYAELARQQLPELSEHNLLLEPQARNTAPCIAWSAAVLEARDPEALAVVLPADHLIRERDGFVSAARAAAAAARAHDLLVTFGVPPRYPETGYGYIAIGEELPATGPSADVPVHHVEQFREKPDPPTAEAYLEAGTYLWNSGIFVWTAAGILAALEEHLPEARRAAQRMLEAEDTEGRAIAYAGMPATSIDFGVMERATNVACVRAPFDWSDVGSWAALREVMPDDAEGNVAWGEVVAVEACGNLVHAPEDLVVLLGVEGLAVVRAGDVLLVT